MISRLYWRLSACCLAAAMAAASVTVLTSIGIEGLLDDEVDRYGKNFRDAIVPILDRLPDDRAFTDLRLILAMPDVAGIEVFGAGGRRIWHAGESLEIVGYRFGERGTLSHISADGTHYEMYWSAKALQAGYGVALRLDRRWQAPILRQVTGWTLLVSIALLVCGTVIGIVGFRRKILDAPRRSDDSRGRLEP